MMEEEVVRLQEQYKDTLEQAASYAKPRMNTWKVSNEARDSVKNSIDTMNEILKETVLQQARGGSREEIMVKIILYCWLARLCVDNSKLWDLENPPNRFIITLVKINFLLVDFYIERLMYRNMDMWTDRFVDCLQFDMLQNS